MKERKATVQPKVVSAKKSEPMRIHSSLVIAGKWLLESGFSPGDKVIIFVDNDRLIIERMES